MTAPRSASAFVLDKTRVNEEQKPKADGWQNAVVKKKW